MHGYKGFQNNIFDMDMCSSPLNYRNMMQKIDRTDAMMMRNHKFQRQSLCDQRNSVTHTMPKNAPKYNYEHIIKIKEQNEKLKMIKNEMAAFYFYNRQRRYISENNKVRAQINSSHYGFHNNNSLTQIKPKQNDFHQIKNRDQCVLEHHNNIKNKSMDSIGSMDDDLRYDTELFMYFITNVNKKVKSDYKGKIEATKIKEEKPSYYKHKRDNVQDVLCLVSESSVYGSDGDDQYSCSFCNMKYTYRRCLINHLKKKHRHERNKQ